MKIALTGKIGIGDMRLQNRQISIENKGLIQSQFAIGGLFFEKNDMNMFIELFNINKGINENPYRNISSTVYNNKDLILNYAENRGVKEKDWFLKKNQKLLEKALISYLVNIVYTEYIRKGKEEYVYLCAGLRDYIYKEKNKLIKESLLLGIRNNIFSKSIPGLLNISIIHYLDFKELLINSNEIIDDFIFDLLRYSTDRLYPFSHMDIIEERLIKEMS